MTGSRSGRILSALLMLLLAGEVRAQRGDAPGSRDHPLFTRMKDFVITSYEVRDFEADSFWAGGGEDLTVEGKKYVIEYGLREGARPVSTLQVVRNFGAAIRKIGGRAFEYTDHSVHLNLEKDGRVVWARVDAAEDSYVLTVVEKAALVQEVTARDMLDALERDGRIALQILFDTGKATIRQESSGVVEEIVSLLRDNPHLRVGIEGHTDAVGSAPANRALSEQRARAVMAAVAAKGIDARRMTAAGFGQDRPVADNETEAGRARNRRVEIVKL